MYVQCLHLLFIYLLDFVCVLIAKHTSQSFVWSILRLFFLSENLLEMFALKKLGCTLDTSMDLDEYNLEKNVMLDWPLETAVADARLPFPDTDNEIWPLQILMRFLNLSLSGLLKLYLFSSGFWNLIWTGSVQIFLVSSYWRIKISMNYLLDDVRVDCFSSCSSYYILV